MSRRSTSVRIGLSTEHERFAGRNRLGIFAAIKDKMLMQMTNMVLICLHLEVSYVDSVRVCCCFCFFIKYNELLESSFLHFCFWSEHHGHIETKVMHACCFVLQSTIRMKEVNRESSECVWFDLFVVFFSCFNHFF